MMSSAISSHDLVFVALVLAVVLIIVYVLASWLKRELNLLVRGLFYAALYAEGWRYVQPLAAPLLWTITSYLTGQTIQPVSREQPPALASESQATPWLAAFHRVQAIASDTLAHYWHAARR
jgi:hypothetical protein